MSEHDTDPTEPAAVVDPQVVVRDGDLDRDVEENIGEERTADDIDPALADLLDPGADFAVEDDGVDVEGGL